MRHSGLSRGNTGTARSGPAGAQSLSRRLVRRLLRRAETGIPDEVARKLRLHVADAVAISFAAARATPLAEQVVRAHRFGSHGGDCAVLGRSERLSPQAASFCNSALAHLLDFDDIHDLARLHPTAVTLPAALATAELVPGGGAKVIEAVALGNEMMCRLGVMVAPKGRGPASDWFLSQLFGYLGAALAAGVVLGLPESDLVSALGLAYMQAAGGKEAAYGAGSTARGIYPAFAAMGGVEAALLARSGVLGPESALDGEANLFRIYLGRDLPASAIDALLDDTGWLVNEIDIKLWPSCRLSHPYIAAALAVRRRIDGAPIERVVAVVNPSAAKLCKPLERRRRPETLQDAKYSIPYMIAFALARGIVDLSSLDDAALRDPAILELASRVDIDESLPDTAGQPPGEIVVRTTTGEHTGTSDRELRVTEAMIKAKFMACLDYAGRGDAAQALWERLLDEDQDLGVSLAGAVRGASGRGEGCRQPDFLR